MPEKLQADYTAYCARLEYEFTAYFQGFETGSGGYNQVKWRLMIKELTRTAAKPIAEEEAHYYISDAQGRRDEILGYAEVLHGAC